MHDVVNHQESDAIVRDPRHDLAGGATIKELKDRAQARAGWGTRLLACGAFLALAGGLALGISRAYSQHQQVMATAQHQKDFVPTVRVATVEASPGTTSITLPATTAAFTDANIYARATGYIEKRNVDIGDHVKAGDLLAELAVPELDHQIAQNEATLVQLRAALLQAQANLNLAEVTWGRDRPLVRDGWVTQQQGTVDVDTVKAQQAAVGVAEANVSAQENLLKVLRQDRAYASVVAPFDGVITRRNVDVGALVQGNAASGTFMFTIMQSDVIRVFVYVPQDAAFGLASGVGAAVRVPEMPGRPFPGKVTRIAEALEAGTRTLLAEIDISNPDGALQPGIYCTVDFDIPRRTPSFLLPADATIFNQNGLQAAVVEDGIVHVRSLSVTHDLGTQIEVSEGVKRGDRVIINPPVNLGEGGKVRIRVEPQPNPQVPTSPAPKRAAEGAPRGAGEAAIVTPPNNHEEQGSSAISVDSAGGGARAGVVSHEPPGDTVMTRPDSRPSLTDLRQLQIQPVPSSARQDKLIQDERELDKVLDRVIHNTCRGC